MRHETNNRFKVKLNGTSNLSKKFIERVNREDFEESLKSAIDNLATEDAKNLFRELRPTLNLTGATVGYSPMERKHTTSHLHALKHIFGLSFMWLTFAPNAASCPLVIKLACH